MFRGRSPPRVRRRACRITLGNNRRRRLTRSHSAPSPEAAPIDDINRRAPSVQGGAAPGRSGVSPSLTTAERITASPVRIPMANTASFGNNPARPRVGITMGDAAGIGPEIVMKSIGHPELYEQCQPLVVGDAGRLGEAGRLVGGALKVNAIGHPSEARFVPGVVNCIDLKLIPEGMPWGRVSPICGDAAYQYVARAVELARAGEIAAICTAPLNKEALRAGGHIFPGHTEMLAHLTGTQEVSMMLSTPKLKVIHVTGHLGLLEAIAKIEPGLVERTIARAQMMLVQAGWVRPRIGVCGINPHAGEHGLFGAGEEESKIEPAVRACQARGWDVQGPLPADALFFRAGRGDFDIIVAMYHDQGHAPVKVLGIDAGVNITVGLPIIRTSVDHGTAFDIAGTGKADERSLLTAIQQAVEFVPKGSGLPISR